MKSILLTLLAIPFLAVSVHAQDKSTAGEPGAKPKKPKVEPADVFKKLDGNADNSLDLTEFKALPRFKKDDSKAEPAFGRKDKDGDKKLSLEEFTAKPEKQTKAEKGAKADKSGKEPKKAKEDAKPGESKEAKPAAPAEVKPAATNETKTEEVKKP